jgi:hypothetical protein
MGASRKIASPISRDFSASPNAPNLLVRCANVGAGTGLLMFIVVSEYCYYNYYSILFIVLIQPFVSRLLVISGLCPASRNQGIHVLQSGQYFKLRVAINPKYVLLQLGQCLVVIRSGLSRAIWNAFREGKNPDTV